MDVKAPMRLTDQRPFSKPVYPRAGGRVAGGGSTEKVPCKYFQREKCNRNPCRFSHTETPTLCVSNLTHAKQIPTYRYPKSNVWVSSGSEDKTSYVRNVKKPVCTGPKTSSSASPIERKSGDKSTPEHNAIKNVCQHWLTGNCVKGDECPFVHSWFHGEGFTSLAKLEGHKEAVSGVAFPERGNKLYSGSRDGTVQLWDCHTGQRASVINLGAEVGSLICEGAWVFTGMPNVVKAWNLESSTEYSLDGPVGEVYSMAVSNDMLFAGDQAGNILIWKCYPNTQNPFQPATILKGHTRPITCLTVGRGRLYSGSIDNTIRVLEIETLKHLMTVNDHKNAPTSLICWEDFLLSCSLDHTIKVWHLTEGGNLEVAYTHNEDHGVLALNGLIDPDGIPVLICSCDDKTVRLYELPSFMERGRIFSKREVKVVETGRDNLFFTDDGTGMLSVWKLLAKPKVEMQ